MTTAQKLYNTKNKRDFMASKDSKDAYYCTSCPNTDLKIGDLVTFTNEYGAQFKNLEVLGFLSLSHPLAKDHGRVVYLSKDSYWFPVTLNSVNKQ